METDVLFRPSFTLPKEPLPLVVIPQESNLPLVIPEQDLSRPDLIAPVVTSISDEEAIRELYGIITSNIWNGESFDKMVEEIAHVETFLSEESFILGLRGRFREMHMTLFVDQLAKFGKEEKEQYASIFGLDYVNDGLLMASKYRNLELMRYHNYISKVLFGNWREPFTGEFTYFEVPSWEEILLNGVEYYYYSAGQCTIELLMERYDVYELRIMMCLLFSIARREVISQNDGRKSDLAGFVLLAMGYAEIDPRMILTLQGPIVIHNNRDYNLYNFTLGLSGACQNQGIELEQQGQGPSYPSDSVLGKPLNQLYAEYCLAQVQPTFFLEMDYHRSQAEQIENVMTTLGEFVMDLVTPIYYGIGDGIRKYEVFSPEELRSIFLEKGTFWNPRDQIDFSLQSIRRLIHLLDGTNEMELAQVIVSMLSNQEVVRLEERAKFETSKVDLLSLFNVGIAWSDWGKRMASENPLDMELRFNPRYSPPEWRQRLRNNVYSQLEILQQIKNKELLWLPSNVNSEVTLDTTNPLNTLEGYIELVRGLNDWGLFEAISYVGNLLMIGGNFYMDYLFDSPLTAQELVFTEQEDEVALIKMVNSLEEVYGDTPHSIPTILPKPPERGEELEMLVEEDEEPEENLEEDEEQEEKMEDEEFNVSASERFLSR